MKEFPLREICDSYDLCCAGCRRHRWRGGHDAVGTAMARHYQTSVAAHQRGGWKAVRLIPRAHAITASEPPTLTMSFGIGALSESLLCLN
eukprot:6428124-Amphidinium_carterae.1